MTIGTVRRRDILEAARYVYRYSIKTPLFENIFLSRLTSLPVMLKMESFQPVHSFKIRGASNKVLRSPGNVVTASSGNHGIAVAYVCAMTGRKAIVVVPENINSSKLSAIRLLGAEIRFSGRTSDERIAHGLKLAEETGYHYIHSFDDPHIISGQGTIGTELERQVENARIIVPVGGGGLISGIAVGFSKGSVYGVQSEGADSMLRSLEAGRVITSSADTVADGISVSTPGRLNFDIVSKSVKAILQVSDSEIIEAARMMWKNAHVLMEYASASTVAALLRHRDIFKGEGNEPVVLIVSGDNVSDKVLRQLIARSTIK